MTVVREHKHTLVSTLLIVAMLFVLAPAASGQVLVFEDYQTTATIHSDKITIERTILLRNNGQAPIIPGELTFRFFERNGEQRSAIPISNAQATNNRGEDIGVRVQERPTETALIVTVWNPLLPGFSYEFDMSYDIDFTPSGILFHELTLPQEQTTVPIINEGVRFVLDEKYHVTYAPDTTVSTISGNVVVDWGEDNINDRTIEYSRLPFPRTGIRAVNAFWITVIVILVGMLALSARKQKKSAPPSRPQYQYQQYQQPPGGGQG